MNKRMVHRGYAEPILSPLTPLHTFQDDVDYGDEAKHFANTSLVEGYLQQATAARRDSAPSRPLTPSPDKSKPQCSIVRCSETTPLTTPEKLGPAGTRYASMWRA